MPEDLSRFAELARTFAAVARAKTLPGSAGGLAVENKASGGAFDPVTAADRAAETALRELIREHFPDHGICGEEYPDQPADGPYSWSLDPIDGTRAYICGLPSWVTLIALLDRGKPVLGLVDVPRLDQCFLGFGAKAVVVECAGERPLRTSGCRSLAEARFSTTDPFLFADAEREGFERLRRGARLARYGLDGYGYALVAAGTLDLIVESGLKPHDYNALIPLIRAAGGAVSDWSGGNDFGPGRIVAAASQALLDEACGLLA